jgi:hypothetical protein
MAAAAPTIRSRSPFGHLSKLAAIRAGSRKIGADAAAFPAPDADTRCTQLDVGEELWICGNPEMFACTPAQWLDPRLLAVGITYHRHDLRMA